MESSKKTKIADFIIAICLAICLAAVTMMLFVFMQQNKDLTEKVEYYTDNVFYDKVIFVNSSHLYVYNEDFKSVIEIDIDYKVINNSTINPDDTAIYTLDFDGQEAKLLGLMKERR